MKLEVLDWGIIAFYMLGSLVLGLYLTRRASSSLSEFFLSGRNLPWWLAGTSMVATTFSSDTPLYVTSLIRKHGIYENWQWWCFILWGMLSVSFFARLWRRAGVLTDVELIHMRYEGRPASVLRGFKAIYFSCIIHTITKAMVILAMSKILTVSLGWDKWTGIYVASGVTIAYSIMSGYWGVVTTDFFQFIIAMVGAVMLAVIAVGRAGGIENITASVDPGVLSFFPPSEGEMFGTAFMAFLGYMGLSWWSKYSSDGGGVIVQRISSCRNEREGLLATFYFNVVHYAIRTWPWVLVGLASLILYPAVEDHDSVYPMMVVDLLPTGMRGLMIASFFAAFMSTLSTYLNLSSAYFVNDFYRPFLKQDAGDRHYILVSRIMMVVLSAITAVVTYYVSSLVGIFKFLIAFGSGTGLVYIVRWFWWRVNAWSEISAMITSTTMSVIAYTVYAEEPFYWKLMLIISVSTVVWVTVTYLTPAVPMEKLVAFVRHVNPGGPGWGPVRNGREGMPGAEGLTGSVLEWVYGSLFLIAITMGTGKFILGYLASAWIWGGISMITGLLLYRSFSGRGDRILS